MKEAKWQILDNKDACPEFLRMYHLAGCDILLCPTRGNARHQNYVGAFTTAATHGMYS